MKGSYECRACGCAEGQLVLDLGQQPLANNFLRAEDLGKPEPRFPLRVFVCPACRLIQITDLVPPVKLFSEYLYFSSNSDAMLRHARQAVEGYRARLQLGPQSLVVEVASNDGYLLRNFQQAKIPCIGIEPAANIAKVTRDMGIETRTEFFGHDLARRLGAERGRADLIIGNNVFAHAPDINDFIAGLAELLATGGQVALEFPYGVDLVEKNEFDTIYHEHVFYFALTPLLPLFRKHGLEVVHVERIAIHGGSLRIMVGHVGAHVVEPSVKAMQAEEEAKGVGTMAFYRRFEAQVQQLKEELVGRLQGLRHEGKRIAAYGASAKGSTLLNYCGLGPELLDFVVDRSVHKQGRFTPGTHLPIIPPDELVRRRPDATLLLTWNFAEEILEQQQAYRAQGGKFIIPIPRVLVV